MRYRASVELNSALLVGDRREPTGFFLVSRSFISGAVLRAGIAREITLACPLAPADGSHWVRYMGVNACMECTWRNLCRDFDRIRFGHCYPEGARVAPMTAYRCKANPSHRICDSLLESERTVCPECKGGMERFSGFVDTEWREVNPTRRLVMRLAVDPYRHVASEGRLYALRILEPGQRFTGWVETPDETELDIPVRMCVHLGAKISSGLGRATLCLEMVTEDVVQGIKKRCAHLTAIADQAATNRVAMNLAATNQSGMNQTATGQGYFSLTLLSDALPYVSLPLLGEGYQETSVLRERLARAILPEKFWNTVNPVTERVVADFRFYGGYQTTGVNAGRRHGRTYIAAGSVFLFRVPGGLSDTLINELVELERTGIGLCTEDGYGSVRVCDEFHLQKEGEINGVHYKPTGFPS
ncbi:MAG TPA: hypothetical protein GX507_10025 [Clostridia bacterium]|nr:hypothetical protein [Clostridia bacterium]